MGNAHVSRRDFLRGAGVAGIAAGAMAVVGAAPAVAAQGAEAPAPAIAQLAAETAWVPVKKAACPGPKGESAFVAEPIAADQIAATEDHDLVIVGAGIGGLMAALKAAEEGADVVCIEKMSKGRGCFECFGAVNAACQEGLDCKRTLLLDEIYRSAYWRTRPEPARTYVDRSGEAADFWQAMLDKGPNGFVITPVQEAPSTCGMPCMTDLIPTELGFYDSPCLPPDAGVRSGYSGIYVCLEMQEVAKQYDNLDLRFLTPGVQLVREDNGAVTGVIAKNPDGSFVQLNASKGVVLATGGYDANPELMEAWTRPEDYATSSWWNPGWGTTGDGHLMGIQVGAQMDPCPQPVMNFRWGNPDSFYDARTWNAIYFAILVNGEGNRFVREDLPFQSISNAQNAQPGYGVNCWEVFDETMFEGMEDAVDEFKEKGWLFEGATPQELASAIGVDPDTLASTIETYNGYFADGVDLDFNRDLATTIPFTGKRYFALTTNSCVLATVGGLTINGNAQVLDVDDQVIKGLYATGNASGNFFAGNYPRHIPGTSIGRAITFGFVAAEHALKGE
ncbi:FAD-binding protein [Adlercreutzia equolifaciens]|uniref:FAD-dependent oxidoreductase n=1 Tax=Adlercreutzia equolifaciens TaxID=446660 RepID=UPI0023B07952|nr:FAD-binding protein [Adlercreutzia equolifaciens]MDE8702529.1 FAD-binding protein [Adlercreutzia equolifaciens]